MSTPALAGRRIVLGVSAGIAAYKSADLVRRLIEAGAQVQVVMTAGASAFVAPMTFQAVSGRPVRLELLDPHAEAGMGHIELARWPDLVLIAPATANVMARIAAGFADDLLTTLCLATDKPIAIAPAMNRLMWSNAATQANLATLRGRGVHVLGPGSGGQACGDVGEGRMWEPTEIRDAVAALLAPGTDGPLAGHHALVTAGPTREPLDPVRYLSNRSTGKMGFAVAAALARGGCTVTLVAGPVNQPTPTGIERIDVETALQMHEAVMARAGSADIFVATAAVADYRPVRTADRKLKKGEDDLPTLALVQNPDILAEVCALPQPRPFTVGFAAETHDIETYARAKLERKGMDMICANEVGVGRGFETDANALHVRWRDGGVDLPMTEKGRLADALVRVIEQRFVAAGRA